MSAAKLSAKNVDIRLDEIEDDVTDLRQRITAQEVAVNALTQELHGMRGDIKDLRKDVIGTFGRSFLALVFLVLVAVGAISSIVGGRVYLDGLGVRVGVGGSDLPAIAVAPEVEASDTGV